MSGVTSNVLSVTAVTTNDADSYSLVVTSSYGSATSSVAVLTVVPPPVFPAIANQTVIAGQTLVVTNAASDPDASAESLTFAAVAAPANSTVNPATGTFTWRPTIAQSGLITRVQLAAQDNGPPPWSATQSFWVTVNQPVPPQLAGMAWVNGAFGLSVSGDAGPDYIIQGTTNLVESNVWDTLFTTNSPALPFWWTDPQTNLSQRYYRVLLGP